MVSRSGRSATSAAYSYWRDPRFGVEPVAPGRFQHPQQPELLVHGEGDELQLTFNIPFIYAGFTADELSGVVSRTLAELSPGESPVWAASNHDVSRFPRA